MRTGRYIGIDYLRAFFSVCVVLVHLGYISKSAIFNKDEYVRHTLIVSDFINFYLLLLAVPIFLIVSNYLFYQKQEEKFILIRYLERIGKLAVFWVFVHQIFRYQGWGFIQWLPNTLKENLFFVMSGGHTIYYFFVSLAGLTIITHFAKRLNLFYVSVFFVATVALVSVLPILSIATEQFMLSVHWSPLNFLPYPFAAILVFHVARMEKSKISLILTIIAGFLIILSVLADWSVYVHMGFFKVNVYAIPAYTRPSLVFISMAFLFISIKATPRSNSVVLFMSNNSLALYCLHPFFVKPAKDLSNGNLLVSLILVLVLSYTSAAIIKQFIQRELIE